MSRHIVYVCNAWVAPVPMQIAEIAPVLNHTTDVRMRVKQGYHHRIVARNKVDHAYNARATGHAHVFLNAMSPAFVDGDKVVIPV